MSEVTYNIAFEALTSMMSRRHYEVLPVHRVAEIFATAAEEFAKTASEYLIEFAIDYWLQCCCWRCVNYRLVMITNLHLLSEHSQLLKLSFAEVNTYFTQRVK